MTTVPTWRMWVLRAMYLILAVGLLRDHLIPLIEHGRDWDSWHRVGSSLLSALCVLAVLGLRYPLKMIPLLMFEVLWKGIWLATVALPLYLGHQMTDATRSMAIICLLAIVIVPLGLPWQFVWREFVLATGDPWGSGQREKPIARAKTN